MEFHEAAEAFPLMEGLEFESFKYDIQENGQLVPIMTFDDKILDGRNRYRACTELGLEPRFEALPLDTDPYRYVMSMNDKRRHLSATERALAAAKLANLSQGSNRYEKKVERPIGRSTELEPITNYEAAEKLNVSERNVRRARRIQNPEKTVPEVLQAVQEDRMTLGEADKVSILPMEEQRKRAAQATTLKKVRHKDTTKAKKPEETNGEIKVLGVGMDRAEEAINILRRIPKNDALRERAFQRVKDWLKRNR